MTIGPVDILDGLTFAVESKGIHCMIGPNGAGKTSALNALTGKLPLSAGDIRWDGKSIAGRRVHDVAALGIGRKLQVPSVFPALTIDQNVDIALWASRIRPSELVTMSPYRWRTRLLGLLEARFPLREGRQGVSGSGSVAGSRAMPGAPDIERRQGVTGLVPAAGAAPGAPEAGRKASSVSPVLRTGHLSGGYGDVMVIRDFSLSIAPGETAFVTGRNGAGKSTLVKMIAGHLPIRAGRVTFRGRDVSAMPAHRRRRLGLGYAPQEGIVFDELTAAENLTLHCRDGSLLRYEALFDAFPFLRERLMQKAGTLSGGEKKILSFCRAFAEDTVLVVLDEPTEGVQPENIARMVEAVEGAAPF